MKTETRQLARKPVVQSFDDIYSFVLLVILESSLMYISSWWVGWTLFVVHGNLKSSCWIVQESIPGKSYP